MEMAKPPRLVANLHEMDIGTISVEAIRCRFNALTKNEAYDHGFYGTLARDTMPDEFIEAYDEGEQDAREVEACEMAYEASMFDLYGDAQ